MILMITKSMPTTSLNVLISNKSCCSKYACWLANFGNDSVLTG